MNEPHEPSEPSEVPKSAWGDNIEENTLGPVGILEAFSPLAVLTGQNPYIFINKAYDFDIPDKRLIMEVSAQSIIDILRNVFLNPDANSLLGVTTALISDGNTSHAIALQGIIPTEPDRLLYFDPWNVNSFLEKGKNIANIDAQRKGKGTYSISLGEFKKVLVACGFLGINKLKGIDFRLSLSQLRTSDFYSFFNIRETAVDGSPDRRSFKLKTGGFQEFIDIEVLVDQNEKVHRALLTVARQWITQMGANNSLVVDIVKSFIDAMIPEQIDLSQLGIVDDPTIRNPDRRLVDFLVKAFWDLPDSQNTAANFKRSDEISLIAFKFLLTFVGKENDATVSMLFSKLSAQNVTRENREIFRLEVDTDPMDMNQALLNKDKLSKE